MGDFVVSDGVNLDNLGNPFAGTVTNGTDDAGLGEIFVVFTHACEHFEADDDGVRIPSRRRLGSKYLIQLSRDVIAQRSADALATDSHKGVHYPEQPLQVLAVLLRVHVRGEQLHYHLRICLEAGFGR